MNQPLIAALEQAWAHHKYAVLEKDPAAYQAIRTLLKDKVSPDEARFWHLIDTAMAQPSDPGRENNAILHVWGYFKDKATPQEKAAFESKHSLWVAKQLPLKGVKQELFDLSVKYAMRYLLESTYFDEVRP